MGLGLKILSVLTGSGEAALLNARNEVAHKFNGDVLSSCNTEKEYILNYVSNMVLTYPKYRTLFKKGVNPYEIVNEALDDFLQDLKNKNVPIFFRVMVKYYDYEPNINTRDSLYKFVKDVEYIISNPY